MHSARDPGGSREVLLERVQRDKRDHPDDDHADVASPDWVLGGHCGVSGPQSIWRVLRDRGAQTVEGPIGGSAGTGDARVTENEVCVGVDIAVVERDIPGCFDRASPSCSVSTMRYWPGFSLNENPPALSVVSRRRSPVSTLMTSTIRPSIALVPSGPRSVPLIVPTASEGFGDVSIAGTPCRQAPAPINAIKPASAHATATQRGQYWCVPPCSSSCPRGPGTARKGPLLITWLVQPGQSECCQK